LVKARLTILQLDFQWLFFSFSTKLILGTWVPHAIAAFFDTSTIIGWIFVFVLATILSIFSFVFGLAWVYLQRRFTPSGYVNVILAFLWLITWDIFDTRIFPWSPVQLLGTNQSLLASASILGTNGWRIVFFLSLSIAAWLFVSKSTGSALSRVRALALAVLTLAIPFVGAASLGQYQIEALKKSYHERQPVVLFQTNLGPGSDEEDNYLEEEDIEGAVFKALLNQANANYNQVTDNRELWIAWPESSFLRMTEYPDDFRYLFDVFTNVLPALHLIGSRERIDYTDNHLDRGYNRALLFDPKNGFSEEYRKHILFPFGEYLPGEKYFPKLKSLITLPNNLVAGNEFTILSNLDDSGPVFIPLICWEILFSDYVEKFIKHAEKHYPGREIILYNPTNDAWFEGTIAPALHAQLAAWQASVFSVSLLRPTVNGISQVVAPWGEVLATAPKNRTMAIMAELPVRQADKKTFPQGKEK
jgi:apolipoprotein N-acyltransferase